MKISEEKYVLLKKIVNNEPLFRNTVSQTEIFIPNSAVEICEANAQYYESIYAILRKEVRSTRNIEFVSDSVVDVFDFDLTVSKRLQSLRNEVPSEVGLLLMSKGISYLYCIDNCVEDRMVFVVVFKTCGDIILSYTHIGYKYDDEVYSYYLNSIHSFDEWMKLDGYNYYYPIETVLNYVLFKKFADVEIKIIDKGKAKKIGIKKEKYISDSRMSIRIIDSTWQTTLIKINEFQVSGHYRMQACGLRHTERKLIWINDHVKHGFIRHAKILKNRA